MSVPTALRAGDVYDASPDFVYAVSLLAALEGATGQDGHAMVLPFLGMARAELPAQRQLVLARSGGGD